MAENVGKRLEQKESKQKKTKKPSRLTKRQKWLLAVAIVLAVVLVAVVALDGLFVKPELPGKGNGSNADGTQAGDGIDYGDGVQPRVSGERKSKDYYTVLILGRDTGGGGNTDTMLLASYDVTNQKANVMSIPRDTMVNVNWDVKKINSVYNMNGGVAETTLTQGFHLVKPTQKVTTYTIGIEQSYLTSGSDGDSKGDESFEVPSNDGKGLTVDLTFTYRFDPDHVADTFTRFKGQSGKDVKEVFIKPNIMSWTKEVTAKYSVIDLLGDQRASLNSELTAYLKDKFEPYGIIIESVSLINIDPDDETRAAVQKKVNAQQDLELAKIEQQTANVNAEKEKEVAITKANQEKETAQINAEAKLIEAQAQADANRLISQSLTPELIQQQMYEKWNGQLPTVQAGSDAPIIVDTTN